MRRFLEYLLGIVTLGGWLIALALFPLMYAAVVR
jgi:hypothetical protein